MIEIKFQADIKNGMIEIPKQYIGQLSSPAAVSIISAKKNNKKRLTEADFSAFIDTKNWKFNREEAN
ncbi:MAG: hypothetical protein LBT79_03450 [Elusimicrobiota bacterium]|jgi:hypothetical protein|nr:hypothetical protein [Elusimicrobiota bacterium]